MANFREITVAIWWRLHLLRGAFADALFFELLPEPAFYAAAAYIICATLVVALKDKAYKPMVA